MFNRTTVVLGSIGGGSVPSDTHTTIVEKRAPTDETLKLLEEMREKTLNQLLAVPLNFNGLDCNVYVYNDISLIEGLRAIVLYQLNNEKRRVEVKLDQMQDPSLRLAKIKAALAEDLAVAMLSPVLASMPRNVLDTLLGHK